jgi:tetratricopeptide (TPR) repeat protein
VESAGLYALGMRRAAADLGLIRLIIYYGTAQRGDHDHGQPGHVHSEGDHRELAPRALAVLDADPAFTYAALFAAGALAFNLQRPAEALEVLEYALARDPKNWKLRAYVAGVGFHKKGDRKAVISALEPVLAYSDCPAMVKNLMAVLYKREGRLEKARALYTELLEHPDYSVVARQQLERL